VAVVVLTLVGRTTPAGSPGAGSPGLGARAPEGSFTTISGTNGTVSSLRGQPTLLWFVTTWCPSCATGTQAMAGQIASFARMHVRVVELGLAGDLGQAGPSMTAFRRQWAGTITNPDWSFGVASSPLTITYDPASDLDIYYLLDSSGRITYVNSDPGSTMSQLLAHAAHLS
jgi:thiol-disulfide isomerase/thioredoxin